MAEDRSSGLPSRLRALFIPHAAQPIPMGMAAAIVAAAVLMLLLIGGSYAPAEPAPADADTAAQTAGKTVPQREIAARPAVVSPFMTASLARTSRASSPRPAPSPAAAINAALQHALAQFTPAETASQPVPAAPQPLVAATPVEPTDITAATPDLPAAIPAPRITWQPGGPTAGAAPQASLPTSSLAAASLAPQLAVTSTPPEPPHQIVVPRSYIPSAATSVR